MVAPHRISSPGERDGGSRLSSAGLERKDTSDRGIVPALRIGKGPAASADDYRYERRIAQPECGFSDTDTVEEPVSVHVEDPEARAENPDRGFSQAAPISSHRQVARLSEKC